MSFDCGSLIEIMPGEIVKIELTPEGRLRLSLQIEDELLKKYKNVIYSNLNLGFKLEEMWPLEGEILLSQLVALAAKLKMQITIGDINLSPRQLTATPQPEFRRVAGGVLHEL